MSFEIDDTMWASFDEFVPPSVGLPLTEEDARGSAADTKSPAATTLESAAIEVFNRLNQAALEKGKIEPPAEV